MYTVWVEGFAATGESGTHWCKGSVAADTFADACFILFRGDRYFDAERLTWWGCRLFDNASDAAKGFG